MKAMFASVALALAPMLLPQATGNSAKPATPITVVVSLNRIALESTEGKAANSKLSQLAQKTAADISARETDGTTKPEDLQKFRVQAQNDFANAQQQTKNDLLTKLNPVIKEVAALHGADIVLSSDIGIVWAAPRFDITNEVLAKFNELPK